MTQTLPYKFPHVEDYIEIIAGYREVNGKSNYSIFSVGDPLISLARYDMKIVPSLAEQTLANRGYTDRQAKLAADLVLKYERQLNKHGLDVSPVRLGPEYRLPLRELDRSTRVWIENDQIKLKFPYNTTLIEEVRTATRESKGAFYFNREARVHEAELTEWNLNWVHSFSVANNFEIDQSVKDLMSLIIDIEQQGYAIELVYRDSGLDITNASDSLREYVETHLGGFKLENILTLCDYAPVLGYTVSSAISNDVIRNFSPRFWSLCANRNLKVDSIDTKNIVKNIIDYAQLTNRFPIFVYEPDLSGRLETEFNKFFSDKIVKLGKDPITINENTKVIYTNKIPKQPFEHIPLMVSSAGMLYGGDRQMWIQAAEKVVYFTKDVYNKNVKGKEVCKLD